MLKRFVFSTVIILALVACHSKENHSDEILNNQHANSLFEYKAEESDKNSLVNHCSTTTYISSLIEYTGVDSNAFVLRVNFNERDDSASFILDLPSGRARTVHCNSKYVVVGFACGGPCFSEAFVFVEEERPIEIYSYCQRATTNEDIITYIKDENFEELIIRNLNSGVEQIADISECVKQSDFICFMDSIYITNKKNLVLEYQVASSEHVRYQLDISELIKE